MKKFRRKRNWPPDLPRSELERCRDGQSSDRLVLNNSKMYDLYALKGMPVRKVADILSVSVPRVYLAKHRVAAVVKKQIAELRTELL